MSGEYDASVQRMDAEYKAQIAGLRTSSASTGVLSGGSSGGGGGGNSHTNSDGTTVTWEPGVKSYLVRAADGTPDHIVKEAADGTIISKKKVGKDYGSGDGIGPAGSRNAYNSGKRIASSTTLGGMVRGSTGGSTSYSSKTKSVSNTNNITVNVRETALSGNQIAKAVEKGIKKMSK